VEFAKPAVPMKLKLGGASAETSKPKKNKDKSVSNDEPPLPELAIPSRPEAADHPPLSHPSTFFKRDETVDLVRVKRIVQKIFQMREAFFFQYPVDRHELPSYYEEIKRPMDLSAMLKRVDSATYKTYGQVFKDFDLIVANCKQFNPPNTEPVWFVDVLDRAWRQEWERTSKLGYHTKRALQSHLKNLMKEGAAYPFLDSIEKVLDQIPDYPKWVPRENWRHLGLIKERIDTDYYRTLEEVDADFQLMLENCFTYNGKENQVYISGRELQKMWAGILSKVRSEGGQKGKRPGGEKTGGAAKKQKV